MLIEGSRYSGVDLKVFRDMFTDVSKGPAASGVPRGVQTSPKFGRPSKIVPNSAHCENC